jgi:Putative prokaryotic signal transducing protein
MAQDPESDPETDLESSGGGEEPAEDVDSSHDLDMVTLLTATNIDSEMEAGILKSLLESNGVPALVVDSPIPSLGYQVQVPREQAEEARRVMEEAQAAGPEAAAEAESESERGG